MLTGDRRWASSRRSGVAVPKPINLPSQRLENHGLDPNVEIVPKGTLSWGSKSSSSASNPWGSSSQSPNTDGGTSSTSHLSGRPSSGGSGNRPSTAGSDKSHESTGNAWGPSSRPSSASSAVGSNQAPLALLRPQSAETKPSSSHLSRFAEASSENPVAWSSAAAAEKLGVVHYKDEGFALASGDFPLLGFEKGNSRKNSELQDHESTNRLSSSSGGVALTKEITGTSETDDEFPNENVKIATVNSWRRDNPPYSEDGTRYSTEKWQGHPRPYMGANMVSPPYDTWNCIPANNPQGGVLYRGPRGDSPYGTPTAPVSFPMEPFPYYHPHIPAGPLANPQSVHPPGVGPRGHHPQTGDVYRHPIPDAFVRPAMPIRPGFYPSRVPYDSYYGPPMGYLNGRDSPFLGMVGGPPVYNNRYPSQNAPDPNSQGRSSECGSTGMVSEKGDSSHSRDTQIPFKALPKQQDCWDAEIIEQNGKNSFDIYQPLPTFSDQPRISSHPEMVDQARISFHENLGSDHGNDGKSDLRRRSLGRETSFHTSAHQGTGASYPTKLKSHQNVENLEAVGDFALKRAGVPQFLLAASKDSSLIQKIEGLNVKTRASDGRHDATPFYSMEEEGNKFLVKNVKTYPSGNEDCDPVYSERPHVDGVINHAPNEIILSSIDKSNGRGAVFNSRRSTHEMQRKGTHSERKEFTQDVHGQRKRSPIDSRGMVMVTHPETSNDHVEHLEAIDESDSLPQEKHEGESFPSVFDSNDGDIQCAITKDLAKQQTKQLEEEEEERSRKQKDELNGRTKAEAELIPSYDKTPSYVIKDKQEESIIFGAIRMADYLSGKFSRADSNPQVFAQTIEELPILSTETVKGDTVSQVHDGNTLKHKRVSYKHKQSIQSEKSSKEKSTLTDVHEAQTILTQVADYNASLNEPSVNSVESTHPRKKYNKSGKNKNKVEEASLSARPSSSGKPISESEAVSPSIVNNSSDQFSLPIDDSQGKGNSQGKHQHSRRIPRNLQGRSNEKFHGNDAVIWAPVGSLNKSGVTDEANQKTEVQEISSSLKANEVRNNLKNKRAEIERYVPKPVAKEKAQQGSIQQPEIMSTNQTLPDEEIAISNPPSSENTKSTGSTAGNVASASESRMGDGKHYKQSKSHRMWQQRGEAELKNGQGVQDQSASKSVERQPDESYSDEWNPPDGRNIPNADSFTPVTSHPARDQGNTGRGKQHQFKGQRDKNKFSSVGDEKNYTQSLVIEVGQREFTASNENRSAGERALSHWQPKPQAFSSDNRQGNRSNDSQNIKKESAVYTSSFQKDQSFSEKGILNGPNAYYQEAKTEKQIPTHRGRPHSPSQGPVDVAEFAPSTELHKAESHNSRFARGSDTFRDNLSGHDNKQHNPPAYRERQRQNSHYGYQPVGPQYHNKYSDRPEDNYASRYRESGRNNLRQSGGDSRQVHTGDTSYD